MLFDVILANPAVMLLLTVLFLGPALWVLVLYVKYIRNSNAKELEAGGADEEASADA